MATEEICSLVLANKDGEKKKKKKGKYSCPLGFQEIKTAC